MFTRICVVLWMAVAGSTAALSYHEKIIPLIAPLRGVTGDKTLAYTDAFLFFPHTSGYNSTNILSLIQLRDFSKRIYSLENESFVIKDIITASNKMKQRNDSYAINLLLLDIVGTQNITSKLLITSDKLLPSFWQLPILTQNKKYLLRASNYNVYIMSTKQLITTPNAKYLRIPITPNSNSDDANGDIASIIVNRKMNRILVAGEDLQLYRVDFSNLPKTYETMNSNIIYGPSWDYTSELQKIIKIPDPKDPKRKTFNAYKQYLSLSPDDNYVAGGFYDKDDKYTGWVRNINTGLIRYLLTGDDIYSSAWSPNGKYLVTLGNYISIRNTKTGKTIQILGANGPQINRGPFFTKQGKLIFSDKNFDMHVITLP